MMSHKRIRHNLRINVFEEKQKENPDVMRTMLKKLEYEYHVLDKQDAYDILKQFCDDHLIFDDHHQYGILSKTDIPDQYTLYLYQTRQSENQIIQIGVKISGETCVVLGGEEHVHGLMLVKSNYKNDVIDFLASISAKEPVCQVLTNFIDIDDEAKQQDDSSPAYVDSRAGLAKK